MIIADDCSSVRLITAFDAATPEMTWYRQCLLRYFRQFRFSIATSRFIFTTFTFLHFRFFFFVFGFLSLLTLIFYVAYNGQHCYVFWFFIRHWYFFFTAAEILRHHYRFSFHFSFFYIRHHTSPHAMPRDIVFIFCHAADMMPFLLLLWEAFRDADADYFHISHASMPPDAAMRRRLHLDAIYVFLRHYILIYFADIACFRHWFHADITAFLSMPRHAFSSLMPYWLFTPWLAIDAYAARLFRCLIFFTFIIIDYYAVYCDFAAIFIITSFSSFLSLIFAIDWYLLHFDGFIDFHAFADIIFIFSLLYCLYCLRHFWCCFDIFADYFWLPLIRFSCRWHLRRHHYHFHYWLHFSSLRLLLSDADLHYFRHFDFRFRHFIFIIIYIISPFRRCWLFHCFLSLPPSFIDVFAADVYFLHYFLIIFFADIRLPLRFRHFRRYVIITPLLRLFSIFISRCHISFATCRHTMPLRLSSFHIFISFTAYWHLLLWWWWHYDATLLLYA